MKSYCIPGLMLALLAACANEHPPKPADRAPVILGMTPAHGRKIIDSVYSNVGVRPDSVMDRDGQLRVVLPGTAFGNRVHFDGKGCHTEAPPFGAIRAVALHAWSARDSSVRSDTVLVAVSLASDTLRRGSWFLWSTKSCGSRSETPVDVQRAIRAAHADARRAAPGLRPV